MLKSAREPGSHHLLRGSSDKTARRMTQHQVRTRSDVMRKPGRMADVYRRLPISGKAIPDALYLLAGRRPIASPGGKEAAPDGGNTSTPLPARLAPGRMVAEPGLFYVPPVNEMSAARLGTAHKY